MLFYLGFWINCLPFTTGRGRAYRMQNFWWSGKIIGLGESICTGKADVVGRRAGNLSSAIG
jgi:hypothetical protein